jgi:hypothetical protein
LSALPAIFPGLPGAALCAAILIGLSSPQAAFAQTTPQNPGASGKPPAAQGHGHGHSQRGKQIHLSNAEGARIQFWKPDLETLPLEVKHGAVAIPSTGVDNYHALVAIRDWGDLHESLIRYEYLRGKPSGESPSKLLNAEKSPFELVPAPLPREHQHYESGTKQGFIVRFQGKPLPNAQVNLETSNGSQATAASDAQGRITLRLPDDFPDVKPGEEDKRQASFTLSAETSNGETHYRTQLVADYRVNPGHWQSFELGLLFVGLGLISGGLIGRMGLPDSGKK